MKYTRGPWEWDESIIGGKGIGLFDVYQADSEDEAGMNVIAVDLLSVHDAMLISVAPEMLDALIALTNALRTFSDDVPESDKMWVSSDDDALNHGLALIKKATTGETVD